MMSSKWCSAVIRWHSTAVIGASFWSVSLCGPLPHGSLLLRFLDCRHLDFWDFNSTVPVDVVKLKFKVNCFFYRACVEVEITVNNLYFVLERAVSGVVGVLWHDRRGSSIHIWTDHIERQTIISLYLRFFFSFYLPFSRPKNELRRGIFYFIVCFHTTTTS